MAGLTWRDIITKAHIEIGAREDGEPLPTSEIDSAFDRLRMMFDEWGVEGLLVPGLVRLGARLSSSKRVYTIGASGSSPAPDIVSPAEIETITALRYRVAGSLDYFLMDQTSYEFLSQNTTNHGQCPSMFYYEQSHPQQYIYFNALPLDGDSIELSGRSHFGNFALEDLISATMPDSYAEAILLNLACKLAPSFGIDGTRRALPIEKRAMKALETIRGRNIEKPDSPIEAMYVQGGRGFGWNDSGGFYSRG